MLILIILLAFSASIIGLSYTLFKKSKEVDLWMDSMEELFHKRQELLHQLIRLIEPNFRENTKSKHLLSRLKQLYWQSRARNLSLMEKVAVENALNQKIRSSLKNARQYPELQLNSNFQELESAFNELELQLRPACKAYNEAASFYNSELLIFPSNLLTKIGRVRSKQLFDIPQNQLYIAPVGV